jgi:hypothetical protein
MTIPDFRDDGRLPEGVHLAAEAEVMFRFGVWLEDDFSDRVSRGDIADVELEMMVLTEGTHGEI